jgi:hypothetical protein
MITLLQGIFEQLGLYRPAHIKAVRSYFRQKHPTWRVLETRTLARETGRFVVAVFYEEPNLVSFPPPYQLFAVSIDSLEVEELPTDPDSPYWLFGRK